MTVGERIRYYRKQIGITQEELARRAGLHPVSVRKYETNKMVPQYDQMVKLAEALNISFSAVSGVDRTRFRLQTVGDLMGLLIVLCESEVLRIVGNRQSDGTLEKESARITFNTKLPTYFSVEHKEGNERENVSIEEIAIKVDNENILDDLLIWERERYLSRFYGMKSNNISYQEMAEKQTEALLRKENAEMEMQKSKDELTWLNGLKGEIWVP